MQVERLTGSFVDALFDMANDHLCLPLPLDTSFKDIQRMHISFEAPHFLMNEQSSLACFC